MIVLKGGNDENSEKPESEKDSKNDEIDKHFSEFPTCNICQHALYTEGERKEFFICPVCKRPLCAKNDLLKYEANFCGYCGFKIYSTLEKTKKVLREKWFNGVHSV